MARDLSEHRSAIVYRWDLDKTYLRTEFDTLRDLVRTAFEPASRKRAYPGAGTLLREIRATEPAAIFILSGSPEQMRSVLEAKLRLDGIRWDGFTLNLACCCHASSQVRAIVKACLHSCMSVRVSDIQNIRLTS